MVLYLILLFLCVNSHVNIPSILLPFPTQYHPIEYNIEATNGCFVWSSSNTNIITIKTKEKCSNQCTISISYNSFYSRQSYWIYAHDENQNINLRTEITIDKIDRIEITTTTRLMNKDDYEILELNGYDSIGNKFSTLEGIPIIWTISPLNGTKGNEGDYLRIEKFSTSGNSLKLKASKTILEMEELNLLTSKILVKGLELGKTNIKAQLLLETNKISNVVFTILQMLIVLPENELFVLPNSNILFKVFTTKRNEIGDQIIMPNNNYLWESNNNSIISINQNGIAKTNNIGKSFISVMYIETPESIRKRIINVVIPFKIRLKWKDITVGSWQWIKGKTYQIEPELLDINDNVITYLNNVEYQINIKGNIKIIDNKQGFSSFTVLAENDGRAELSATFIKANGLIVSKNSVHCYQDIFISVQIVSTPKYFRISNYGTINCKINTIGGYGEYVYTVNNDNIVVITNDGIIIPKNLGKTNIIINDFRNHDNFDSIIVEVLEVGSIEIKGNVTESLIGNILNFTAVSKDSFGNYFDTCSSGINWKIMDNDIFHLKSNNTNSYAQIIALKTGSTSLIANYGKAISEIQIFAYDKLLINLKTQYLKNTIFIPPHVVKAASFIISYEGGPIPWYLDKNLYYLKWDMNKLIANVLNIGNNEILITCKEYGESLITIEVGNKYGFNHPYLSNAINSIKFICNPPSLLILTTKDNFELEKLENNNDNNVKIPSICKERIIYNNNNEIQNEIIVKIGEEIDLIGYVKPSISNIFTNSSSINYIWTSSNTNFITLSNFKIDNYFTSIHIKVGQTIGKVNLNLSATHYNRNYFNYINLPLKDLLINNNLYKSVTLNIVNIISVYPKSITLFNHHQNFVILNAKDGSGYYNFSSDDSKNLLLEHIGTESNCIIYPKVESINYISVNDICFNNKQDETKVIVTISEIHGVNILITDQLEISESTILKIEAIDINGIPFEDNQYKFMDIKIINDNNNILIEKRNIREYIITGASIGMSIINVIINGVQSKPSSIIIYEHFNCYPKEIHLIPLAQEDIKCKGGPPLRSNILHQIKNGDSIQLNGNKIIGEKKGFTTIESVIYFIELLSGNKIIKGNETCNIIVKHLTGLRMEAHQTTIEVGGQTKIKVIGEADGIPVSIASTQLDFMWNQTDDIIVNMLSIYNKSNITINEEMSHTILLIAKSIGQTRINVHITNINNKLPINYNQLTSSLLINVIDPLTSMCADKCRNIIDIPVNSITQITTNRDPKKLNFIQFGNSDIISIDPNGIIKSNSISGSSIIQVIETETGDSLSYIIKVHQIHAIELLPITLTNNIFIGEVIKFEVIVIGEKGRILKPSFNKLLNFEIIPSGSASIIQNLNLSIIEVTGLKPGKVVIKIKSLESVRLNDEVRINIINSIFPINPIVSINAEIQFISNGSIKWYSKDNNIVLINLNGLATSKSYGKTVIFSDSSLIYTKIIVSPIKSIYFEPKLITSEKILIPIILYSEDGEITQNNNIHLNLNSKCVSNDSSLLNTSVEIINGKLYCSIQPKFNDINYNKFIPKELIIQFIIIENNKKIYNSVSMPLKIGMIVIPNSITLELGKEIQLDVYRIIGNVNIIDLSGKLLIREIKRNIDSISFLIKSTEIINDQIQISDTNEIIKINVSVVNKLPNKNQNSNLLSFIILIGITLLLAIFIYNIIKNSNNQIRNNNINNQRYTEAIRPRY